jgi:hypothetical protein
MPRSQRTDVLNSLENLLFHQALELAVASDDEEIEAEETLELIHGIQSSRYLSIRNEFPKTNALHDLLFEWPENEFKETVRLDKRTLIFIENLIKDDAIFSNNSRNPQKPVRLQLVVTLERLGCFGNGASVGRVARANGIGNGTVTLYTRRVIDALLRHWETNVRWPTRSERQISSTFHDEEYQMPGAIGIVDGTHFILSQRPAIDGEVYFTRKKRYAVNAQLVCDEKKRFLLAHIGYPGSCGDAFVFSKTSVAERPMEHFSDGEYLLGNKFHASLSKLIVRR